MKRFLIAVMLCAVCAAVLLTGCAKTGGQPAAPGADGGAEQQATVSEKNGGLAEADISLCYNGEVYTINQKAAGLISVLGDDYTYEEAESCAYDGMDKYYEYSTDSGSVTIFTIPLVDGEDTICQIETTSPLFSTPRGITIGSTLEDVEKAYGTDCVTDGDNHYYFAGEPSFSDTPHIYFTIEDGKVTLMSIYSARNHG